MRESMNEWTRRRIRESKAELSERPSDPKLRAATERILAMTIDERLRQIEAEANFFLSVRSLDDPECDATS